MVFLPVLLLTVAATSDSFVIGFNYGIKDVRINRASNLFISLLCFAGTYLSMLAGRLLGGAVDSALADRLGAGVLLALGAYMLVCAMRKCRAAVAMRDPALVDKDRSKVIELRESLFIGLLLTLNNMGLGIGVGIAGLPILLTSAVCAAASFFFIGAGCMLGGRLRRLPLARYLEILSALLVLLLGAFALSGIA